MYFQILGFVFIMSKALHNTITTPRYCISVMLCLRMIVAHKTWRAGSRSRRVPSVVGETSLVLTQFRSP